MDWDTASCPDTLFHPETGVHGVAGDGHRKIPQIISFATAGVPGVTLRTDPVPVFVRTVALSSGLIGSSPVIVTTCTKIPSNCPGAELPLSVTVKPIGAPRLTAYQTSAFISVFGTMVGPTMGL